MLGCPACHRHVIGSMAGPPGVASWTFRHQGLQQRQQLLLWQALLQQRPPCAVKLAVVPLHLPDELAQGGSRGYLLARGRRRQLVAVQRCTRGEPRRGRLPGQLPLTCWPARSAVLALGRCCWPGGLLMCSASPELQPRGLQQPGSALRWVKGRQGLQVQCLPFGRGGLVRRLRPGATAPPALPGWQLPLVRVFWATAPTAMLLLLRLAGAAALMLS